MILKPTAGEIAAVHKKTGEPLPRILRQLMIAKVQESIEDVYDKRVKDILETMLALIEAR